MVSKSQIWDTIFTVLGVWDARLAKYWLTRFFSAFALADVNDRPLGVFHDVDAGQQGQQQGFFFQFVKGHVLHRGHSRLHNSGAA